MVGVQSLSIGLSIALVVCTGAIVGTLSIRAGQEATDNARATGDRGVASCLESSDKDIRLIATRYLGRVTGSVEDRVDKLFSTAAKILETGAMIGRSVPPEMSTGQTPEGVAFIDSTVRQHITQSMRANFADGITQSLYRWGDGTGEIVQFMFTPGQAVPRSDGTLPWATIESQTAGIPFVYTNGEFGVGQGTVLATGESGPDGRMLNSTTPCWAAYTNDPFPDLNKLGFGNCPLPREYYYNNPVLVQSEYWMLRNAKFPESPTTQLAPADEVVFSPMFPYFGWLIIQAHIAFTHPDMPDDIGPRQGKRVGYFSVTLEGDAVSKVFKEMPVPEGSILYCVDRNPWTGDVGQLIATNYLRLTDFTTFVPPGGARAYPLRVPIHVTNHTLNASTDELSEIGEHGRDVFARGMDGYEQVANESTAGFIEWEASDGTLFWTSTLHMKFANLNWYISLLVPRGTIMDSIDASVLAIRAANAADKADADKKQERSLMLTIIIAVVVATVLMAASVLMTKMILSPIVELGDDMASVATMHVERVAIDGPLSSLSEVHRMQESFRTMVRNLIEYKQYMPQSVLIDDDDQDESETHDETHSEFSLGMKSSHGDSGVSQSMSKVDSHTSPARTNASRSSMMSTAQSSRHAAATQASKLTDQSLKKKSITVVCYNLRGWLKIVGCLSDREFQSFYSDVTTALLRCIQVNKGVTDIFAGDHFLVAHNAFINQATHKASALRAALQVSEAISGIRLPQAAQWPTGLSKLSLSYAACSGEAKVGQMGCAGMKKVTIHSSVTPFAVALERYNKTRGYRGVADHFCAKDIFPNFLFRKTDDGYFEKRMEMMKGRSLYMYEVMGTRQVSEEEWMYQMEQAEAENPYAPWNRLFDLIVDQQWVTAKEVLEKDCMQMISMIEIERMRGNIADEKLPAVELF